MRLGFYGIDSKREGPMNIKANKCNKEPKKIQRIPPILFATNGTIELRLAAKIGRNI